jgi:AcrR family transcriptional regulator
MEATAQIMRDEGYAAATSRRVAARAGVRSALVYYYFPTMDDLFLAVLRSGSEASLAKMRQAITAEEPLRALWEINTDSRWSGLYTEFVALANHRKVIGAELKAYAERVRDIETAAATVALRRTVSTSASFHRLRSRCWLPRSPAACATKARSG